MLHNVGEWIEHWGWVQYVAMTGWLYSSISVVHYFTLFVTVGTTAIIDLRVLQLAATRKPVAQIAEQLYPWMWGAFWLAIISGFLMCMTDAGDYFPDKVFEIKMATILIAVIFTALLQQSLSRPAQDPPVLAVSKVLAGLSLFFWIGSILAGVEIAAISGLG